MFARLHEKEVYQRMSIPRITPEVIQEFGVGAEPDVLSGTPAQNKAIFDRLVREKVAVSLNALLDEWDASGVCGAYAPAQKYQKLNTVIYEGATYECLQSCIGVTPAEGPYWRRVSATGMTPDVYDPQNRKTDVFSYSSSLNDNTKMILRAEMAALMERGFYDTKSRKTDIFNYADSAADNAKSTLRAEMTALMERGSYDTQNRKTDVYAYAEAQGEAAKTASGAALAAAESRLTARSGPIFLGTTTSGTGLNLSLPAPDSPLTAGARISFQLHKYVSSGFSATLAVGSMSALPLYFPYLGSATLASGCYCEALYTGSEYKIYLFSDTAKYYDKTVLWNTLSTNIGTWDNLRCATINGITYLQGTVTQDLSVAGVITSIPQGCRPPSTLRIASAPGTASDTSYIEIRSNGLVYHIYNGIPWRPLLCLSYPSEL